MVGHNSRSWKVEGHQLHFWLFFGYFDVQLDDVKGILLCLWLNLQ